jgi:hypothetical protein
MPFRYLWVLLLVAVAAAPVSAQRPPPAAALGEPDSGPPGTLQPILDPFLRPLGSPDEPFRPFAPLGPPPNPASEGIGTRFGLGMLAAQYGYPGYGALWIPEQKVLDQPTNLGLVRQDLSLFAPIAHDGDDTAAVGLGVRNSLFYTKAVLPNPVQSFPKVLWDIEAGMAYSHHWENGWTTGAVVSAGSASDEPFGHGNVLVASVALYATIPTVGCDAWIIGFSYIPTSDFPYPLPIFGYYWQPNDDFSVNIGAPLFLKWKFADRFTFDFFYVPIRNVNARVTWDPPDLPDMHVYGAFNWSNEAYFLANRTDDQDRFYGYEKRLTAGAQFDLLYRLRLDVSLGYAFDRFYFIGHTYSDRDNDRVNVRSGFFGALQLRLQF